MIYVALVVTGFASLACIVLAWAAFNASPRKYELAAFHIVMCLFNLFLFVVNWRTL